MLRPTLALLTAALLLWPLAASAQTPKPAPTQTAAAANAAGLEWHMIDLRYIAPNDLLKLMHWNTEPPGVTEKSATLPATTNPNLPQGVLHIFGLASRSTIVLEATDESYKQVQEIIKTLDVAPQQVEIKALFAAVPLKPEQKIDLSEPNQAIMQLHKTNAIFYQPSTVTANNGILTVTALDWQILDGSPLLNPSLRQGSYLLALPCLRTIPRIYSDGSILLTQNFSEMNALRDPARPNSTLAILHTIPSGGTVAYDITSTIAPNNKRVFLFMTVTIRHADGDNQPASGH